VPTSSAAAFQCDQSRQYSFFSGSVCSMVRPNNRGNRNVQRADPFLLSFLRLPGRSANMNVSLPYAGRQLSGQRSRPTHQIYRSVFWTLRIGVSVNLKAAHPCRHRSLGNGGKRRSRRQPEDVGSHGQYDPTKLVNWGANRWLSNGYWPFQTLE